MLCARIEVSVSSAGWSHTAKTPLTSGLAVRKSPAICDTFAGSVKSTCFILMSGRFFCIHSRTPLVRSLVLK